MTSLRHLLLLLFVACSGCANTTVTPIYTDAQDMGEKGFRYYASAPFILVYADGKGGLTSKLIYLPDTRRWYSLRPHEFVASNKASLKFSNGVLTEAKIEGDGTALPKAIVESLKSIAVAKAAGVGFREAADYSVSGPYLYRIDIGENGKLALIEVAGSGATVHIKAGVQEG